MLVGLAEVALKSPAKIQSMFTDNGDGTFSVGYFNNGVADYVTVDRALPVYGDTMKANYGTPIYAGIGGMFGQATNELWVALAEKAYAQMNESGWIGQDNTNTYAGIDFGHANVALSQITGKSATFAAITSQTETSVLNQFNTGKGIVLDSKASGVASNLVANHSYAMLGFNSWTRTFQLYNPWGSDAPNSGKPTIVSLTWTQLQASFTGVHIATL